MARGKRENEISSFQNAAQTLLANIQFASIDDPIRSIVVTSTTPNEGKTTVALQLAIAMASSGSNVLLVECDMRRRCLAGTLGIHPAGGIHAILSKRMEASECIVQLRDRLYFLDSEPNIPNPPSILSSNKFRALIAKLHESFDYIVFDTPPIAAFVDAAVLGSIVDGTIMVVRERHAKTSAIKNAYEQLMQADANIVGVVMNFCREERSEYYYEYYNKNDRRNSGMHEVELPTENRSQAGAAAAKDDGKQ